MKWRALVVIAIVAASCGSGPSEQARTTDRDDPTTTTERSSLEGEGDADTSSSSATTVAPATSSATDEGASAGNGEGGSSGPPNTRVVVIPPPTVPPPPTTAGPPPPPPAPPPPFDSDIAGIGPEQLTASWRDGCPVPWSDLRLVTVSHWGFDGALHTGQLVVHQDVAVAVVGIFYSLYNFGFPIERMQPVDAYGGDDNASMAANNTSAFNCRSVTGQPGVWSEHSYGRAIDVNPVQNPYVRGNTVLPPAGAAYLNRDSSATGLIRAGGPAVTAFAAAGWGWGGSWSSLKDYQHFSASGR